MDAEDNDKYYTGKTYFRKGIKKAYVQGKSDAKQYKSEKIALRSADKISCSCENVSGYEIEDCTIEEEVNYESSDANVIKTVPFEDAMISEIVSKKAELTIVQQAFEAEHRIFMVVNDKGRVLYIATTSSGFSQLSWLRKFSERTIMIKVFKLHDKEKCMMLANQMILKYKPVYNDRLNKSALTVKGIKRATGLMMNDIKRVLKRLHVDLVVYNGLLYVDLEKTEFVRDYFKLDEKRAVEPTAQNMDIGKILIAKGVRKNK